MSEEGNNIGSWWCFLISFNLFGVLSLFYVWYSLNYFKDFNDINSWQKALLFIFYFLILMVVLYYAIVFQVFMLDTMKYRRFNELKSKCFALAVLGFIQLFAMFILFISGKSVAIWLILILILILFISLILLVSTKFFYTESECWWKRIRTYVREFFLFLPMEVLFNRILLWFTIFSILPGVQIIFIFNLDNPTVYRLYEFLVSIIENRDLFGWIFNLFLFTFFAFIISVIGKFFDKTKDLGGIRTKEAGDSEFLFYMLSVRALIIWAVVLIIVYSLTRTLVLKGSNNTNLVKLVLFFYTFLILVFYYFLKKFFELVSFAMPAQRLQIKTIVLLRSPLNKGTLRLWKSFWKNEEFSEIQREILFLSSFIPKIVYYKTNFQLKEEVTIVVNILHDFSDNISKRYSEALAREVLNIVLRWHTQPKRLPEYLVDILKAYKNIVYGDKLICEESDFEISFKEFFKDEPLESLDKYQYLNELIYQVLVTLRKSIEKLRNDGYFEKHDGSRKILCDKFNDFVKEIMDLKCDNNKIESTLKTESAKRWLKEACNLLKILDKVYKYCFIKVDPSLQKLSRC